MHRSSHVYLDAARHRKTFYPEDWGFLASLRFEGELFVSLGASAKQLEDVALAELATGHVRTREGR